MMLSQLSTLLDALRSANLQVKQVSADSYIAQCPCPTHGADGFDEHPSLSIRVTADNKILIHCFAGCQPAEILAALGLNWNDVAPAVGCRLKDLAAAKGLDIDFLRSLGWYETNKNGVPAVAIPYYDADGNEVTTRYRIALSGDRFRWRTGSKLTPYGLPRLDSFNRKRPLWIVEGETDTATLWFVGAQAIGLPGKNTISTLDPLTSTLQNFAQIIVWQEPDAEDFGQKVAQALNRPVKVVHAAKAGAKDINELWLKHNGDLTTFRQKLEALLQAAEEVAPPSALKLTQTPPLAKLLDNIANFIRKYVVLEQHQLDAVVLWVSHTWFISATNTTPYLWINSPSKRCGKTRLAEVLACLVNNPRFSTTITPAALFRVIAANPDNLTLILDEVESLFTAKERAADITALLNSGFRRGQTVLRAEKRSRGDFVIAEFPTFCPKVLVGLAKLPDTISDRSISITLQRKKPTDEVADFDSDAAELEAQPIREGLKAWAQNEQFIQTLRTARPQMPPIASDRAKEAWRLLIAIADEAGGEWSTRARQAMVALERKEEDKEGHSIQLLRALKTIFAEAGKDRLTVDEIASHLAELDDPPVPSEFWTWVEVRNTRKIGMWLSRTLKPYGISPVKFWDKGETKRGYEKAAFSEVWERYCPDPSPEDSPSPDTTSPSPTEQKNDGTGDNENARDARTPDLQYLLEFSHGVLENENARVARNAMTAVGTADIPDDLEVRMACPRCGFWKRYPTGDLLLGAPRCPICGSELQESPEPDPPLSPVETNAQPQAETSETEMLPSAMSSNDQQNSHDTASLANMATMATQATKSPWEKTNKIRHPGDLATLASPNKASQKIFSDQPQGELFELVIEADGEPTAKTSEAEMLPSAILPSLPFSGKKTAGKNAKKHNGSAVLPFLPFLNKVPQKISDSNQPQGQLFELVIEPDGKPATETAIGPDFVTTVALADPAPSSATAKTDATSPAEEEKMVDTLAFFENAFGSLADVLPFPPADYLERPWESREERIQ